MNWYILIISISATLNIALACSRVPSGTTAAKSPGDENYMISIAGNPQTFIPGQKYNVSIMSYSDQTFISFMLGLELENSGIASMDAVGTFEIVDIAQTRFSPRCANMVENTNTNVKTQIDVVWVAPSGTGGGCILLRATVIQHRDVWFMDDGFLTKKLCEEENNDEDSQPSIMDPCCACDEAKYELTFEGKWSRHTHPKDFPANSWRTRFSDIIGASHTIDYRFWEYGKLASDGVKEVGEYGSTKALESELKDKSDQIRTIIKARGISYPNVTGKTFAVFRVDSNHHLISLVSMIDPSPDWIVGVSGLELCLPNCTWIENKVYNLYPWDVGTDAGASYMSPDQPQNPPDYIRRIKPNYPNDPRSPFYDPSGAPMKPLATLHLSRRRLYEKTCDNNIDDDESQECATTGWSQWDDCSAKCGPGKQYRTREFKDPEIAKNSRCRSSLKQEQDCEGRQCEPDTPFESANVYLEGAPELAECAISDWTEWSSCSASCGVGTKTRSRHYYNNKAKEKCEQKRKIKLRETRKCHAHDCGGDISNNGNANEIQESTKSLYGNIDNENRYRNFESFSQKLDDYIPPECGVSHWSDFSPCLGPCGAIGTSERQRIVWNKDEVFGVQRTDRDPTLDPCRHIKRREVVNCTLPSCDAIVPRYCYEEIKVSPCRDSDVANYWFYDHMSDQCGIFWADMCDKNRNKFSSKEECEETCHIPRLKMELQNSNLHPLDCIVSEWQSHQCNATCGEGVQIKTRKVLRSPKYGGKPCPKHFVRLEKCYQRCDDIYTVGGFPPSGGKRRHYYQPQQQVKHSAVEKNECQYSEWTAWTPCTASCGDSYRQKTRTLINNTLSYKCKDRARIEKCQMQPCPEENDN